MMIRHRMWACVLALGCALPTAAAERELGLEDVLKFAEENAPAIGVAERRVDVARADVVAASPWLPADPTLDVGAGGRVGGGQDGADVSVGVSQAFEIFGEGGLRRDAAERGVDAVRVDVARTRFLIHQAVHSSFLAALVADAEVLAADAAMGFAQRLVEVAEARVNAGEASSLTVRLANTALSRAKEQALTAAEVQTASRLALGREAGFDDATSIKPRGTLPVPRALPTVEELVALAEAHEPQLATLRAQVQAAQATSALAQREGMPKPTIGIGYSLEGANPSSSAQTQQVAGATLALPLPLFRGNDAERARSSAQQRVIEAELAGERRQLAGRVAEARTRADAARTRLTLFADEILPGIDETLQQLEKAFRLGELDLTEVMVGREQVLAARRDALLAWRSWFDARAGLEAAIGYDLPDTEATSTTSSSSPSPSITTGGAP